MCDLSLVDAASFAAHKFYGPKGIGLLFLRSGLSIQPIMFGGSHENERRPGTENVAAIAGMAAAAEWALSNRETEQESEKQLRDELWTRISQILPDAKQNARTCRWLANTLNVSLYGYRFRDAAHRARFGRRLCLQRLGLHGGISRRIACFACDGLADGARAVPPFDFRSGNGRPRKKSKCRWRSGAENC